MNTSPVTPLTVGWNGPVDWRTELRLLSRGAGADECWMFNGTVECGFGVLGGYVVHRLAYMLVYGSLERKQIVRQTCGKPLCVNPAHLRTEGHSPVPKTPKPLPMLPQTRRKGLPRMRTSDEDLAAGSLRRTSVARLLAGQEVRATESKRVQWLARGLLGETWRVVLYRNGRQIGSETKPFDAVRYLMSRGVIDPA